MSSASSQKSHVANAVHQPSRINPSLMKLKLLDVLRNNDSNKLLTLLNQIDEDSNNFDLLKLKNEILLFAVQVAPLSTVKFIIDNNLIDDVNSQDSDGNTALHLAASSNRNDVLEYLLQLPSINDCLYNKDAKQPIQCATNIETAHLMDFLRSKHIEKIASQLRIGFETRNFESLEKLLSNPRDKELLDINGTDPVTMDTVLIEFVKKNDYEMVKFILDHGGDPFKRSLSGKLPEESTTDLEMKKLISESFNKQNIMDTTNNHHQEGSPTHKGFLKKWTNFAGGYKLRWFVLDSEARLSYYKSPNDMNNTCRGMIHLAHAMLRVDSSENTKFEIIIQNPSDGTPVRWHLIANHATEAQKWVWILQNAITFAKDYEKKQRRSVMLSHILHEDLSDSSSPSTPQSHSFLTHHSINNHQPATIPESGVLSNDAIENETSLRKHVSVIISDANDANSQFKELIKETDSETELPLKTHVVSDEDIHDHENKENNDDESFIHENNIDDQNTNSNDINSLRNQPGPLPDRTSQYNGTNRTSSGDKNTQSSHVGSASMVSVSSSQSNASENSPKKTSRAKNLYRKPLNKLSHIGRKTRKSFIVEPKHSNSSINDNSSFMSNDSSFMSGSDNKNMYNEADDDDEEEDYDDEFPANGKRGSKNDLSVVRNQINIQLHTFKDFLGSTAHDDSVTKLELIRISNGILSTLDALINEEGDCINNKYNELVRRLEKQQKISSIWENSIKQLELEIRERESKIVELEDKLKAVRKSLRTSILHQNQNIIDEYPIDTKSSPNITSAAALARKALTANMNSKTPVEPATTSAVQEVNKKEATESVSSELPEPHSHVDDEPAEFRRPPIDSTLSEFLEESDDSDDEFFDAEESDEVKDMSILARRETLKARSSQEDTQQPKSPVSSPAPSHQPLSVPTIKAENVSHEVTNEGPMEALTADGKVTQDKVSAKQHAGSDKMTTPEPDAPSVVDDPAHLVVNNHELKNRIQHERYKMIMEEQTFEGYEDPLRSSLAPEDNRPKISLWGVLKSLVGKDMTKMTLPVSFNEPTSLLQRNVEVVEYSDLLDKASAIESSTLRLVYVATFAASEYASTVGRIAKPFNPLLGETFEYARPDKGYRCFAEQVSHHPPISALVAESPSWSYYGESNVKTKFLGRSFDIKHLGTWYCEVFPDSGVVCKDGSKTEREVYSWKKVNNSVIGIIVGNPTIDNYGDMEIHNHMTGDYMKFNFKPRGWRASSAYEVKGEVFNAKGKLMYYVGGHWNSKIYCKPADDKNAERFLVWEAAPRKEMMFHLTNFAATLNAPQPHLLPKIACTDTRLRPDQRAMEDGNYDLAAEEKNRVEEKQREARKKREMSGEAYKPTFFARDRHPVTGEEFWRYKGTYWEDRHEGKLKDYNDIF